MCRTIIACALAGWALAGCGSTSDGADSSPAPTVEASSSIAPATGPDTTDASATEATLDPRGPGTFTFMYRPLVAVSDEDLATLVTTVEDSLNLAGFDPSVRTAGGGVLVVEVPGERTDEDAVRAAVGLDDDAVSLRPVIACSDASTGGGTTSDAPAPGADGEVLPLREGGECVVGPVAGTGAVFEADAAAETLGENGWGVIVGLRSGPTGIDVWNAVASECYEGGAACPSRQLALEVDGEIVSAPTVNVPSFDALEVQIAGTFTNAEAEELARLLRVGAVADQFEPFDATFEGGST